MSWYPKVKVNEKEYNYLKTIQHIFKVMTPEKKWVPYILQPHQIEWHRDDVAIQQENAKHRVVIKSRNTSFTTSSLISNLMCVPFFPSQIVPFTRLNMVRANDLLSIECRNLIKHMTPVKVGGRLFPFNPKKVDMGARGRIIFKEYDVEFRAFPATNASAENIRGLRISGSGGIIDEGNFMRDFMNIYIANRDAFAGTINNKSIYQLNIGSTLKGVTPFKLWLDKIKASEGMTNITIYEWPVFDMNKVDFSYSFYEQNIEPIVPWHNLRTLWQKYVEDENTFLEEYCCIVGRDEMSLYPLQEVMECVNPNLINYEYFSDNEPREITMGIDPSGEGNDYASIVIIEWNGDRASERKLWYKKRIEDLSGFEEYCSKLISRWKPVKCRIDGNGLGYQVAQDLKKKYPNIIEIIRGKFNIKSNKRAETVPFKEFQHTNLIYMIKNKKIELLEDDLQYTHFSMWKKNYTCESSSEYGHGDTIVALSLAVLPYNWKQGGRDNTIKSTPLKSNSFNINNVFDRIKFYEKEKRRKYGR